MSPKEGLRSLMSGVTSFSRAAASSTDEGFWLFSKPPLDQIQQHYGIRPSAAVLERLSKSAVRFKNLEGGSGVFVSADGLVVTNLHVLGHFMAQLVKAPDVDLGRDGFFATTLEEEVKISALTLDAVESETDVTALVLAKVRKDLPPTEEGAVRRMAAEAVAREMEQRAGTVVEVVALNAGAQYVMYRLRRYTDIRLVLAPELAAAHAPRSFPSPEFDFLFLRAYADGKPARPTAFVEWSMNGPMKGDFLLMGGFPTGGLAGRHRPLAGFEMRRDVALPLMCEAYSRTADRLEQWSALSADNKAAAEDGQIKFYPLASFLKEELNNLRDGAYFASKKAEQDRFLVAQRAQGDKEALKAFEDYSVALGALARGYARGELVAGGGDKSPPPWDRWLVWGREFMGPLVSYGQILLRVRQEPQAPDGKRPRGLNDSEREALEGWLLAPTPMNLDWEAQALRIYFELLFEHLPSGEPVVKMALDGKTTRERADELVRGTQLGNPAFRKKLYEADSATFADVRDPLLDLLRDMEPEFRRIGLSYEADKDRLAQAEPAVVRAMASVDGVIPYPDPTTTLRLSYGVVDGFDRRVDEARRKVAFAPVMTLATFHEWCERNPTDEPYDPPARWRDAGLRMDKSAVLGFASTADIFPGSSGSATVDREGRLIGLAFSAVFMSTGDDYSKWSAAERALHVATPGILEAVKHVFGASRIVDELTRGERV